MADIPSFEKMYGSHPNVSNAFINLIADSDLSN